MEFFIEINELSSFNSIDGKRRLIPIRLIESVTEAYGYAVIYLTNEKIFTEETYDKVLQLIQSATETKIDIEVRENTKAMSRTDEYKEGLKYALRMLKNNKAEADYKYIETLLNK